MSNQTGRTVAELEIEWDEVDDELDTLKAEWANGGNSELPRDVYIKRDAALQARREALVDEFFEIRNM